MKAQLLVFGITAGSLYLAGPAHTPDSNLILAQTDAPTQTLETSIAQPDSDGVIGPAVPGNGAEQTLGRAIISHNDSIAQPSVSVLSTVDPNIEPAGSGAEGPGGLFRRTLSSFASLFAAEDAPIISESTAIPPEAPGVPGVPGVPDDDDLAAEVETPEQPSAPLSIPPPAEPSLIPLDQTTPDLEDVELADNEYAEQGPLEPYEESAAPPPPSLFPTSAPVPREARSAAPQVITIGPENNGDSESESSIVNEGGRIWVREAKLNDVFQYLAQVGDFQFFHNSMLEGPTFLVTGHLNGDDPFTQMEELGLMYGVTVYQKGSTVYAFTEGQLGQLPRTPMQYALKYLRPNDIEQIKTILLPLLTPGTGTVDFEPKTNTLIIYDSERRIDGVREILSQIDQPKRQIAIETKILRIKSQANNKIGVDWTSVLGTGLPISASSTLNTLFGLPDADSVSQVITLTKDARSAAEALAGSGLTGTPDDDGLPSLSNSLSSSLLGGAVSQTASSTSGQIDPFTGAVSSSLYGQSGAATNGSSVSRTDVSTRSIQTTKNGLVLSPLNVQAVIRALNTGNLAQQESSPTLITEDNEEGMISIVDRVPIIISTISETDFGQNISEEVRYRVDTEDAVGDPATSREIGVTVSVRPTILPDDTIRMLLRPRSAQIVEFVRGQSGNIYPRVNESTIETIARVPNGHSLLIGGFYENSEADVTTKVPILGDVPGLNHLFKSTDRGKEQTSLVFIVTPTTYEPISIPESDATTRRLHDLHVLPLNHSSPDRKNPGLNHESKPFNVLGNMFNINKDTPSENSLSPDHRIHSMSMDDTQHNRALHTRNQPSTEVKKKRFLFDRASQ